MDKISRLLGGQRGFTLLEMATVTAIMAALAAIVAVAVTGTAGDARASSKAGDMKNVDTGAARYEAENAAFPYLSGLSVPSVAVAGAGDSNTPSVIKIVVDTATGDFAGSLPSGDLVTCSTTNATTSDALLSCFAPVDFSSLVPAFLKNVPQHAGEEAKNGTAAYTFDNTLDSADFSIDECTVNGETCEFYFADEGEQADAAEINLPTGALLVWNVDKNNNVVVLKPNSTYGTSN